MGRFRLGLALSLSAAFAISLVMSLRPPAPTPASAPAPAPLPIVVRCEVDPASLGRLNVTIRGTTSLPDGSPLTVYLSRFRERDRDGRLEPELLDECFGVCTVSGGRFSCSPNLPQPGLYRVRVEPTDPLHRHRWDFEFALWNDVHLFRVDEEYRTIVPKIRDVCNITNRMMTIASREFYRRERRLPVLLEAAEVQPPTQAVRAPRSFFSAALKDFSVTARLLVDAPSHFFWKTDDGSFGGAFDADNAQWVKGPDARPFEFTRTLDLLWTEEVLARREYALWMVKEVRRAGITPIALTAIRSAPFEVRNLVDGLERGGNLNQIEERIRGEARPQPVRPDPPIPPQFLPLIAHRRKVEEARKLLAEADRLWGQIADEESPRLYRRLAKEFPETLDELGAASRVRNRSRE